MLALLYLFLTNNFFLKLEISYNLVSILILKKLSLLINKDLTKNILKTLFQFDQIKYFNSVDTNFSEQKIYNEIL
jgi:hypothetical protein